MLIRALAAGLLCISAASIARAQDVPVATIVEQAVAARDSGQFARAAELLRDALQREPDNGDAARLLAQTLYWLKDIQGAAAAYEQAVARHPDDTSLRLDYARMLVDLRRDARATEILRPLVEGPDTRSRAATLLGTLLYWQGDLAGASRNFRAALSTDPSSTDAARMLGEIRSLSAPWLSLEADGLHDDQPLDRIDGNVEAGFFVNPLLSVSAHVRPMHFRVADSASANIYLGEVGVSHFAPSARMETRLSAGVVHRDADSLANEWTARGSIRFRLPNKLSIEASVQRAPYLSTIASISQPVMVESGALAFALNNYSGWLGEAAVKLDRFPDDNKTTSAYAWALAPVIRSKSASMSIGYSFATQDADSVQFVLNKPNQSVPPSSPSFDFSGRYDPYYTPSNIISHSALASLTLRPSAKTTVTARAGYAFHATENAPTFVLLNGSPIPGYDLQLVERKFNPWDAHIVLASEIAPAVALSASIDRMKTAFYTATSGSVKLTYQFLPSR